MNYGDSVQKVLLRKIRKAELDLVQLKLDYCRFVFGLTHRARVISDGTVYVVRSVDVDTMKNTEEGGFSRPAIAGLPLNQPDTSESIQLGTNWSLDTPSDQSAIK